MIFYNHRLKFLKCVLYCGILLKLRIKYHFPHFEQHYVKVVR